MAVASADLGPRGFLAGRSAARLNGLDGFDLDAVEVLVPRPYRNVVVNAFVASTDHVLDRSSTVLIDGLRCVTAERLILDAPLFGFSQREIEGGESRLERWVLPLIRGAGLPRPTLQVVHHDGTRHVARVDMQFAAGLVIEIAGHGTHSTRRQRQSDEQRRTELTLRGLSVVTFTYEDIRDRPDCAGRQLRTALTGGASTAA